MNELRDVEHVKKISGAEIFRRLRDEECVSELFQDGMWKKVISEKGLENGFFMDLRISKKGTEYEDLYCDRKAQKKILNMVCRDS